MTSITDAAADRVQQLLIAYPKITLDETREILVFLKKSPALDVALFEMRGEVKPALTAFKQDHVREFGIGPIQWAVIAILVIGMLIGAFLLWDWAV
jgi:hypothetical protein